MKGRGEDQDLLQNQCPIVNGLKLPDLGPVLHENKGGGSKLNPIKPDRNMWLSFHLSIWTINLSPGVKKPIFMHSASIKRFEGLPTNPHKLRDLTRPWRTHKYAFFLPFVDMMDVNQQLQALGWTFCKPAKTRYRLKISLVAAKPPVLAKLQRFSQHRGRRPKNQR